MRICSLCAKLKLFGRVCSECFRWLFDSARKGLKESEEFFSVDNPEAHKPYSIRGVSFRRTELFFTSKEFSLESAVRPQR